ncbi:MAG: DUF4912 domain-containing protein [Candidatus Omnitrophica bacterium]|nr:DUF4912 domain-containing protein [Candidatus Omnitrophota bacterium]
MGYGQTKIVLMVKDPWWLFAYWEISPDAERAARSQLLPHEVADLQSVLRVYDVTAHQEPFGERQQAFDVPLSGLATNWYLQTNAPGHAFIVEIGLLTRAGRFLPLARSNRTAAPRFGPSDVIDEAWRTTDEVYWKLVGTSTGIGLGSSPGSWAPLMVRQLSSGQWSSATLQSMGRPSVVCGFWCRINADLVIHGATESRAKVLIQGQPVAVRHDGTFSIRLACPEGTRSFAIDVISADGRHTNTVTPLMALAWSGSLDPNPDSSARAQSAPHRRSSPRRADATPVVQQHPAPPGSVS